LYVGTFTVDDGPAVEWIDKLSSESVFTFEAAMPGFDHESGLHEEYAQPGLTIVKSLSAQEAMQMVSNESGAYSVKGSKYRYLAGYGKKDFSAFNIHKTMENMGKEEDKRILVGD
jgi:hypothetical protein